MISGLRLGFTGQVTTDPTILVYLQVVNLGASPPTGYVTGTTAPTFNAGICLDTSLPETPQSQFALGPSSGAWAAEPTYISGDYLYVDTCHPQGNLNDELPFTRPITIGGGKAIGLILQAGASNTVYGCLLGEE